MNLGKYSVICVGAMDTSINEKVRERENAYEENNVNQPGSNCSKLILL